MTGDAETRLSALHRLAARPAVGLLLGAAALASFALFALGDVGRAHVPQALRPDTQVLYVAGRMWWRAESPYPSADFVRASAPIDGLDHDFMSGFGYPPAAAPLCLFLGALSLRGAFLAMLALNLAAVAVVAVYAYRLVAAQTRPGPLRDALRWFVPALVVGNPFTTHIVHQGQTTLIATALVLAGWHYVYLDPRPRLAALLLGLATMKPQIALLPAAWVALERRRTLLPLALVVAVLSAYPIAVAGGPLAFARQWSAALADYTATPISRLGFANVFGIRSLLTAAGVGAPPLWPALLAIVAVVWVRRARFPPDALLALLASVSPLFLYAHDYDLAALVPTYAYLWKRGGRSNRAALAALAFLAAMFAPQRFVRGSSLAIVVHWRELVLLAALGWLLWDRLRTGDRETIGAPLVVEAGS
jgi:hypothetical protein